MKKFYRLLGSIPGVCLLAGLAACGSEESDSQAEAVSSETAAIEGEVFYRERMLLPPGAEVEVQLQDISRADAPASVMATVMFKPQGAPPWPFSIAFQPAEIDERRRYALRATVSRDGQLLFSSNEYIDPFAGNPVQVLVQRVAEPVQQARPGRPSASTRTPPVESGAPAWVLATLSGEPAPVGAGGRAIDLVLDQQAGTASGFGGCNRYTGSFSNEGHSSHGTPIDFGDVASTMMACVDGEAAERSYLKMLGEVDAYRMEGDELALLSGDQVVATFTLN